MPKNEHKVSMKDERGRKSFTLVNAGSEAEAQRRAEREPRHAGKTVTSVEKTGRSF
jgi:hypothetical protein